MLTAASAAKEVLARREARSTLHGYINYTTPNYVESYFSTNVCAAIDKFIEDCFAGKRPILVLQAPPQHGKSEIVSRKLPAYILGKFPQLRVASVSYAKELAHDMSQHVRRNIASDEHQRLFPAIAVKSKYDINRMGEFSAPGNKGGSYKAIGVDGGLTGRPVDIGIIDDPIKNSQEALSATTKESHWNFYQSTFISRLSKNSGQIIMATSWAQDDLVGRILNMHRGDERLTHLRFPALNCEGETGFDPALPIGALIPELHPESKLRETKATYSDYWWSAIYQQNAKPIGGNVFKDEFIQYYTRATLPAKFDKLIMSVDCTFKDTDNTDFVVCQIWGKKDANSYLLDQIRKRMSFTNTCITIVDLKEKWGRLNEILIEDKANGPAVIDTLKKYTAGIIPIEPDGSKLARAHAVTSYWEARNIFLPDAIEAAWIKDFITEITTFPAAANDDQVDSLSQALRRLYPLRGVLKISDELLKRAYQRS